MKLFNWAKSDSPRHSQVPRLTFKSEWVGGWRTWLLFPSESGNHLASPLVAQTQWLGEYRVIIMQASTSRNKHCLNIATGKTYQAITPFHFFDYSNWSQILVSPAVKGFFYEPWLNVVTQFFALNSRNRMERNTVCEGCFFYLTCSCEELRSEAASGAWSIGND